jgi:hypothetical protein
VIRLLPVHRGRAFALGRGHTYSTLAGSSGPPPAKKRPFRARRAYRDNSYHGRCVRTQRVPDGWEPEQGCVSGRYRQFIEIVSRFLAGKAADRRHDFVGDGSPDLVAVAG